MKKYVPIIVSFLITYVAQAQEKFGLIDSRKIIQEGIALHEKEKYADAIKEYQKVPINDTNYILAQYEIALSARIDKQYALAKEASKNALNRGPSKFDFDIWNNYGSIYDEEKKYDSANYIFNKMMSMYPNSHRAIHSLGVNYLLQEKADSAFHYFKKALMLNPYNVNTHYTLGNLAFENGYPIQAMMSYAMAILLEPNGYRFSPAFSAMYNIANISEKTTENRDKRKPNTVFNEDYTELETYFISKIALEKNYKIQTSLDEPFFRQLNLIFEKMNESDNEKEFWNTFYGPIYKEIFSKKLFEGLTYRLIAGIDKDDIQKKVKSKNSDIVKVVALIQGHLERIGFQHQFSKSIDKKEVGYYYENLQPIGKGILLGNDAKTMQGTWEFYDDQGNIKSMGVFKNGKSDGLYKSFYPDGLPKEQLTIVNEKATGEGIEYYNNGIMKTKGNYIRGDKDGLYEEYYKNGSLASVATYKLNKKNGPMKVYYPSGELQYELNYSNDMLNGLLKEYYRNGTLMRTTEMKNDKANGKYIGYFLNGNIESEGNMSNGERDGLFTNYYNDKKVASKVTYKNGKADGEALYYYQNGVLKRKATYDKGDETGTFANKLDNDKLFNVIEYKKGRIKKITYYHAITGAVTGESVVDDKQKNQLKFYDEVGNLTADIVTDREGYYNGEFKNLYNDGSISRETNYEKGKEQGKGKRYYRGGQIKEEYMHVNDELDGEYIEYHENGKVKEEGTFVKGKRNGYWYNYNTLGQLTEKEYFIEDEMHGPQLYYAGNGKINKRSNYEYGFQNEHIDYDTNGHIIQTIKIEAGKENILNQKNPLGKPYRTLTLKNNYIHGDYIYFYPNGKKSAQYQYKHGVLDGPFVVYYPNGNIRTKGYYQNGNKEGRWEYFLYDSKMWQVNYYSNNNNHGKDTVFYSNGSIESIMEYVDDEKHNWYEKYAPDGSFMYKIRYMDGTAISYTYTQPDGNLAPEIAILHSKNEFPIVTYYKNGKKSMECTYKNGVYEGKRTLYYPNGNVSYEAVYKNGLNHGLEKDYHPNGQLAYERTQLYDMMHGLYTSYNDKGQKQFEENYIEGYEHGTAKYYDDKGTLLYTIYNYWGTELDMK
ncbi:MAG: hypothetical protein R2831_03175 [Chitinophagaceae bacterium]